jgi:hypothetical protein
VSYERGPRFVPADSEDPPRRIRRLEDWAGRHDQWSAQAAVDGHEKVVRVEERVTILEGKVTRLFASVGEHRLKWGIVAWIVGTAVAAAVALLAR